MDPPPEVPPPPPRDWSLVDEDGPERPAPRGFIHLSVAKELYGVLQDVGADPEAIIAEAGLDPHLFGNPRNLISVFVLGNFLHLCAERTNCPHISLLVGQQGNSGKTGGGSAVFASLTRLPLILWRDGSTR
jgi:hypothetical protein